MDSSAALVRDMPAGTAGRFVGIADDAALIDAARLLVAGTDILIVCDSGGVLQGVVTKTDIVKHVSLGGDAVGRDRVGDLMTRDVVSCRAADSLHDVSRRMSKRHLKNIPVVDAECRPTGILTARAILRVLLAGAEYQEAQLSDYVKGVGYR